MFSKELHWYIDNQSELLKKYEGKVLVIRGEKVLDDYDDFGDAYHGSVKKYGLGNFCLMECTQGVESYTDTVYSPFYY
jgi:hypothetical protein